MPIRPRPGVAGIARLQPRQSLRNRHESALSPADAPDHLTKAHGAAKKQVQRDGDGTATVSWEGYYRAQGGMACGHAAAIKLAVRPVDTLRRYGDAQAPRPVGVETSGFPTTEGVGVRVVESERRNWTIERAPIRRLDWRSFHAVPATPAQPWTRVNNCTGTESVNSPLQESRQRAGPHPEQQRWPDGPSS